MKIPDIAPPADAATTLSVVREIEVPRPLGLRLLTLTVLFPLTEGVGLGMLLPILSYVERGGSGQGVADAGHNGLARVLGALDLPVTLPVLLALALIPMLLRQLVFYFANVTAAQVQYGHQATLRQRHVGQFLRAAMPFYIRTSEGRVISTMLIDADRAATIVRAIVDIAASALLLVAYVALLFWISPLLTALSVPLFAFAMLMIRRHLQRGREFGRGIGENSQTFSQRVTESMRGIRLIKMRGLEESTIAQLRTMAENLAAGQTALQRVRGMIEATTQPILILGTFLVLYLAVDQLGMRLAELGMFMFLVTRSVPQLVAINNSRLAVHSAVESHIRIKRLAAEAAASRDVTSGTVRFDGVATAIAFENVSFSYERDGVEVPALRDVSLTVPRGQTVALVGPSGAGKSTLVDLIPRFYDPTAGRITIDGRPIADYEITSLRRRIGFVMQDAIFFHDTVRANIEIGLDRALSDAEMRACLVRSHAMEFVDAMPRGVDTVIGERGLQVSGGQRQRLAIARALAQDPDILILDEPTSSLDSLSEAEIQASLEGLRGTMTVVVIAHRLATIRNADLIFVLERGHVVDTGTHASLQREGGTYERLVAMQSV